MKTPNEHERKTRSQESWKKNYGGFPPSRDGGVQSVVRFGSVWATYLEYFAKIKIYEQIKKR